MSLEENKAIARRSVGLWSSGDTTAIDAAVDEIFAPDYVNYQHHHGDSPDSIRGAAAWKRFIAEFHAAFPDFHDTVELQVAEGDKVVTRFISQGTQTGAFLGHLPTGRHARWTGIAIDRIGGGKIVGELGQLGYDGYATAARTCALSRVTVLVLSHQLTLEIGRHS